MASAALFHRKTVLSAPLPSQPAQPFLQHLWLQAFQPRAWLPQAQLCLQTRQRSSSPASFLQLSPSRHWLCLRRPYSLLNL
ncbi:hypothetical protein MIC97_12030 [Aquamicrobium sp. NLF2-7]|uniref:hypothetical protein n=1 Tax=Aquamicrobium sp. NLF2-7 TaxID=2918753 RepID=UPI001EFA9BF0|nr:hypothetical protein [Aquamicrobium sp. NLF2-7]